MSLYYTAVALVALCAFVSLGVDYGRVQVAKSELRAAADAAARAAAAGLETGVTAAENSAVTVAQQNKVDGQGCQLTVNQDVEFGLWDPNAMTFTVLHGSARASATAVRVTARRTRQRGNSIPLAFGSVLGISTCDIQAKAIAARPDTGYGVIGLDFIRMTGNSSDSYWSPNGYTPGNFGAIASNGSISLSGNSSVHGDARPGVGQQVYGAEGRVAGSTAPLASPLVMPNASAGLYAYFNDNWRLPNGTMKASSFDLGNKDSVTVPAGNYYFNNFSMAGGAQMNLTGPTTLYIYGSISISGHVATASNLPKNLKIVTVPRPDGGAPGTISISTQSALYADIYAPQSAITLGGSGDIYGSVVGKSINMTGSSAIHYDLALKGNLGSIALVE